MTVLFQHPGLKADYRTKVTLPGVEIEQKPTVIEQFAYSDTWSDGTASYLAMITPLSRRAARIAAPPMSARLRRGARSWRSPPPDRP